MLGARAGQRMRSNGSWDRAQNSVAIRGHGIGGCAGRVAQEATVTPDHEDQHSGDRCAHEDPTGGRQSARYGRCGGSGLCEEANPCEEAKLQRTRDGCVHDSPVPMRTGGGPTTLKPVTASARHTRVEFLRRAPDSGQARIKARRDSFSGLGSRADGYSESLKGARPTFGRRR